MRRLVCTFVVHMQQCRVFSLCGPYGLYNFFGFTDQVQLKPTYLATETSI